MFCKHCGARIVDGAAFCTSCGAAQAPIQPRPQPQQPPQGYAPHPQQVSYQQPPQGYMPQQAPYGQPPQGYAPRPQQAPYQQPPQGYGQPQRPVQPPVQHVPVQAQPPVRPVQPPVQPVQPPVQPAQPPVQPVQPPVQPVQPPVQPVQPPVQPVQPPVQPVQPPVQPVQPPVQPVQPPVQPVYAPVEPAPAKAPSDNIFTHAIKTIAKFFVRPSEGFRLAAEQTSPIGSLYVGLQGLQGLLTAMLMLCALSYTSISFWGRTPDVLSDSNPLVVALLSILLAGAPFFTRVVGVWLYATQMRHRKVSFVAVMNVFGLTQLPIIACMLVACMMAFVWYPLALFTLIVGSVATAALHQEAGKASGILEEGDTWASVIINVAASATFALLMYGLLAAIESNAGSMVFSLFLDTLF